MPIATPRWRSPRKYSLNITIELNLISAYFKTGDSGSEDKSGKCPYLPWSPDETLALNTLIRGRKGRCQICGPNAFNRYGFDDQIPNRVYAYNRWGVVLNDQT